MAINQNFTAYHFITDNKPDGGQSFGTGFCIAWQRGSVSEKQRNGAFLIEVLEACLDKLKLGFFCQVSTGIGYTIAWDTGIGADNLQAKPDWVLAACLDELIHKNECFPCEENRLAIVELHLCISGKHELKRERLEKAIDILNARLDRRKLEGIYDLHIESEVEKDNTVEQ